MTYHFISINRALAFLALHINLLPFQLGLELGLAPQETGHLGLAVDHGYAIWITRKLINYAESSKMRRPLSEIHVYFAICEDGRCRPGIYLEISVMYSVRPML